MFLKRITLNGFKSFADRTEFDFQAGLTSIVGPNGCGKSNVLDAVRWVLGEQSAKSLRGTKMADVIFAGSRSRKSANYAEVELLFDNRARILALDEDEVSVGRVLYASGESEYRLNGNAVRLKDVRDLFLDTGVGVDAYSVIEQGRVDALLQANPLERREIFEEAAGISRYKVRRAEAQRKLERSQNNLLRLTDVLDELEKRLRSVRLAAGKARNYLQYDARLRELRSAFALAELHELEQTRAAQQARAQEHSLAAAGKRAELAATDAQAAQLGHDLQRLDERIQAADRELIALQGEAGALTERIAQGERRIVELEALRTRRGAQEQEIAGRHAQLAERIVEAQHNLQTLVLDVEQYAVQIAALRDQRRAAEQRCEEARRSLDLERTALFDAARRASLVQNSQLNVDEQARRIELQAAQLAERRGGLAHEQAALAERAAAAAAEVLRQQQLYAELEAALQAAERQFAALQSQLSELQQALGQAKEARSAAASHLALLEDLERRHEGVDLGAQAVLAWRDEPGRDGGVVGLVADCLRIDDPRVAVLQPVLAGLEQHVVVRDLYAFLAELRRRGAPDATVGVIALDRVGPDRSWRTFADAPGFVARAADWVSCASEHRALAEHLLGRVVIVDELERALALASNAPDGYLFVTLAGESVAPGGRLTIGASRAQRGLISRKAEVRQLGARLEDLEAQIDQMQRRRGELERSAADVQLQREAGQRELAAAQRRQSELRAAQARCEDEAGRIVREQQRLADELAAAERLLAELGRQREQLVQEGVSAGEQQRAHEARLDTVRRDLESHEAVLGELSRELTDLLVEVGRAAERRDAGEDLLADLRHRSAALEEERTRTRREAQEAGAQIAAASAEVAAARSRQDEVAALTASAETRVTELREARQGVRQQLEQCGAAARELHRQIEALDAALHECQAQVRECDVRRENLCTRVRDELALDLPELYRAYEHAEQDWQAIRAEIDELRQKIARLGHVNLDAIAELEELTPRYENLVAQRDDLNASIAQLTALIEDLDRESRARFAATFASIRTHFQELFRKLFGGGKADIILEDPAQPLECGIEIIARPPGKEPQSISLLSGGEKTMTAVALLLAVFKSKPSPFAILDEVDAALDEANVGRFTNVIQEFSTESQFIVITHSKRTMQSADMLYGITMEEPGVSKRVSVRFEERVQAPTLA
jgi:chromosome segregation protein